MLRSICLIVGVLFAVGCGGGGGSAPDYAGMWVGTLSVAKDGCGVNAKGNIESKDRVNQNGDIIVLDAEGVRPYSGTTTDSGFIVSREDTFNCRNALGNAVVGTSMIVTRTVEYFNVQGDLASQRFTWGMGQCSDPKYPSNCNVEWAGIVQREKS